jgi:hypothetical protein
MGRSALSGGLLAPLPDAMHCVGGFAKMVIQQMLKSIGGDTAVRAKTELQRRGVLRSDQQRNTDWVLCATEIVRIASVGIACNDGGASIPVPPESAALLRALVELRSEACFSYAWGTKEPPPPEHAPGGGGAAALARLGGAARAVLWRRPPPVLPHVARAALATVAPSLAPNLYGCVQMLKKFHPSVDGALLAILRDDPCGLLLVQNGSHVDFVVKTASYHYSQEQVASPLFVLFILVCYADYLTGGVAWFKDDEGG